MKRKHYDTDYAAICDVARWDEHIMKGNNPFSFGATTTTPDGSSRSGNARQKAENKRLYEKGKELLKLNIKIVVPSNPTTLASNIDKKYIERRRLCLKYY